MSDQAPDTLERLAGFEILPESPEGRDDAVLVLWTKSTRFQCVVDRSGLERLCG